MKRTLALLLALTFVAASSFAQNALTKSATLPKQDGVISPNEYQFVKTVSGMTIGVTLGTDDMLYVAVQGPTAGWVGAGVGGLIMNGSRLFLGAVQNGSPAMIEKSGVGHFYSDAKNQVAKTWTVKSDGSTTTMELALPASAALWKGQINMIFAYASAPSFTVHHRAHTSLTFTVS